MRAKDLIKVYLDRNGVTQDITEGILTIETASGVDSFEGIWQTPEVGQFRIVTRNPDVDPYVNEDARYNAKIIITSISEFQEEETVFTGFITDINVEYRPNDDPIITINGTDIIGLLNRSVITQAQINLMIADGYLDANGSGDVFSVASWFGDGNDPIFPHFFGVFTKYQLGGGGEIQPIIDFTSRAMPKPGETIWDFTSKLISSDLAYAYVTPDSNIFIAPYYKYDPGYYPLKNQGLTNDEILNNEASVYLSSDPDFDFDGQTGFGYKAININDGFDRTVNQIIISSTSYVNNGGTVEETTTEFAPITLPSSINEWGPAELSLNIMRPEITTRTQAFPIALDIFEESATPELSIASITIDKTIVFKTGYSGIVLDNQAYYENFTPSDQIKIYHKINDSLSLNNLYTVVGVKNEINETDWRVELILRKSEVESYLENAPEPAEISINPTSGTTATTFNGTVTNYSVGEFDSIEWMPNNQSLIFNPNPPSLYYDNDPAYNYFNGLTTSWNYDDDGPLAPTGIFGPNTWAVTVWIENNGWKTLSTQELEVAAGPLSSSFTYEETAFYGIKFTDTSIRAEEWTWNFGDGTTSTQQNPPTKYYSTSGTYTVTLTVSDGISTAVSSQNVVATVPPPETPLPIRYIRVSQSYHRDYVLSASPDYTRPRLYDVLYKLRVKNNVGTVLSLNKPVIEVNNQHGIIARGTLASNLPSPCYNNSVVPYKWKPWSPIEHPYDLTNTSNVIALRPKSKAFNDEPGDCYYSQWDFTLDLQSGFTNIYSIEMDLGWFSFGNPLPVLTFEGSIDGNDWIELGKIQNPGSNNNTIETVVMTPSITLPPTT